MLVITMPDGVSVTPGDRFSVSEHGWLLKGRENLYRVKGRTVYLGVLASWIENQYGWKHQDSFDLVFDQREETIYLRIDAGLISSLDKLNSEIERHFASTDYHISKMIEGQRLNFFSGIKFDGNEVRLRCRQQ